MKIELIAIDLDGTLLNSEKKISVKTAKMIQLARERAGVRVVLITARPPRTSYPYHQQLGLTDPLICFNGALAFDTVTGRLLMHKAVSRRIIWGVIRWARKEYPKVLISADIGAKWYTDAFDPASAESNGTAPTVPDQVGPIETWLKQSVTRLQLTGKSEWIDKIIWAVETDVSDQVLLVRNGSTNLHVMHPEVSKLFALQAVAQEMGISPEKVMAIGDNANDAGMIQWAGIGVAMANSHHATLALADHITGDNNSDGVGRVIRDLVLMGKKPQGA